MEKMKGAGYVICGTPSLTDIEEALNKTGDRDFYKKTTR